MINFGFQGKNPTDFENKLLYEGLLGFWTSHPSMKSKMPIAEKYRFELCIAIIEENKSCCFSFKKNLSINKYAVSLIKKVIKYIVLNYKTNKPNHYDHPGCNYQN